MLKKNSTLRMLNLVRAAPTLTQIQLLPIVLKLQPLNLQPKSPQLARRKDRTAQGKREAKKDGFVKMCRSNMLSMQENAPAERQQRRDKQEANQQLMQMIGTSLASMAAVFGPLETKQPVLSSGLGKSPLWKDSTKNKKKQCRKRQSVSVMAVEGNGSKAIDCFNDIASMMSSGLQQQNWRTLRARESCNQTSISISNQKQLL